MTSYIQYEGDFRINDRVITPDGAGYVGALYPDTPYYKGRLVQVTLDGFELGEDETWPDEAVRRYSDAELELSDAAWDGYASQRDLLGATVYNVHAQSPRDMTPERWAVIKRKFAGSARQCLEQADLELEDM